MSLGRKLFMLGVGLYASMVAARADASDYYKERQMKGSNSLYTQVMDVGHGYKSIYGGIADMSFSDAITNGTYVKNPPKDSTLVIINGIGFDAQMIKDKRFIEKEVNGEKRFYIVPIPEYILKEADSNGDKFVDSDESMADLNRRLEDIN